MTLGDWCRLLAEHQFRVSPQYWPRALFITACAPWQSLSRRWEEFRYRSAWEKAEIPPPVFVLGHWRSGTTFLHQLLSLDERFHAPTMEEVLFPHSMLVGGPMSFFMSLFLPEDRGVDRVRLGVSEPFEDEFALAISCRLSSYLGWSFPSHADRHERELTLEEPGDQRRWKEAMRTLAGKWSLKHGRPILFKSPPHTARVRHLLDLFPKARFVHIHRDPASLFLSTVKLVRQGIDGLRLQTPGSDRVTEEVIARYRRLYEAYLRDRRLLGKGQLVEVSYADLEAGPIETLARVYDELNLPSFDSVRPAVENWLESRKGYVKNEHPPLSPELASMLKSEWSPIYETWGYALDA
jgi:hypothetical protein